MGHRPNKFEKHELLQALKDAASNLGHTPTRAEYKSLCRSPSSDSISNGFGGWTLAIQAAGLGAEQIEADKSVEFPQADTPELILEILERHRERKTLSLNQYKTIVAIGDVHFPYAHAGSLNRVYEIIERYKPDVIVQVGDLWDMFAASKFPKSLNGFTPEAEFQLSRDQSVKMWETIKGITKKAECFQLLGNHDVRPLRRILEKWPEGEFFIDKVMKDLFTFDGVHTVHDSREELIIGDIAIMHGYLTGTGKHRDFNQMNVIHGHTHHGGVSFKPYQGKTLWELDCGLVADPDSAAMAYRQQKKIHNLTPGVGVVDQDGPRFIPF